MASMRDAKILEKELLIDSFKKVVRERIQFTDDDTQDWIYLDSPQSIVIIALTKEHEIVLVKIYRHNLRQDTLELPAGHAEHGGETPEAAAKRELLEETGYESEAMIDLGSYYVLPSETNRWTHYFLALDAVKVEEPQQDNLIEKYFDMSVHTVPFKDIETIADAARQGISGVETFHGLRLASEYLEKQGTAS